MTATTTRSDQEEERRRDHVVRSRADPHRLGGRRRLRLPRARSGDRRPGDLPHPPGRRPGQLGPPSRRWHRGAAPRHHLRQPGRRRVGGSTPNTIEAMAHDAVAFIRALGLEQVDLLGFSMGGMIAQLIAADDPQLVRKVILAGTGPAGGDGITRVTRLSHYDTVRGLLTLQDPKQFLFFTRTAEGRRAGKDFLARLKERTDHRDRAISLRSYGAQLKAIHRWGQQSPADLSVIHQPVLVANGESDRMVPTGNSRRSGAAPARTGPGDLPRRWARRHLPVPPAVCRARHRLPRRELMNVQVQRRSSPAPTADWAPPSRRLWSMPAPRSTAGRAITPPSPIRTSSRSSST